MISHAFLRNFLVFALGVIFVASQSSLGQPSRLADISGAYSQSSGFVASGYKLKLDGTYTSSWASDCCNEGETETGTFSISGDLIHFKPKWLTKGVEKIAESRSADGEKEFDMYIIRLGERRYLIDSHDVPYFAAAVNLGLEPRFGIINEHWLTQRYYLRRDGVLTHVHGTPSLPADFRFLIPPSPVKLIITKIEEKDKHQHITARVVGDKEVRVGMCFIGRTKRSPYENLLWVTSAEKKSVELVDQATSIFSQKYRVGQIITDKSRYNFDPR
jgi:hypothetical protein